MQPSIQSFGEFQLIERLKFFFPTLTNDIVLVGRGDDCAVIQKSGDTVYVVTVDMLAEGTHFLFEEKNGKRVGRKAASVNLSDLASMGATPTVAFLSLGLPKELPLSWFDHLMEGLQEKFQPYQVLLAGGNFSRSEKIIIDITMIGIADKNHLLLRSRACVNDEIYITGYPGCSKLGLELFRTHQPFPEDLTELFTLHFDPTPQVELGHFLAHHPLVHSCIDCSDGLVADIIHLCEASKVGCILVEDFLPISPLMERGISFLRQNGVKVSNEKEYVLYGGEDYGLIFTAHPSFYQDKTSIETKFQTNLTRIGKITDELGKYWLHSVYGNNEPLSSKGWDHFLSP